MTSEIREWLRELAPEPRRRLEVSALLETAHRRRRRRILRRGLGVALASLVVVGGSAGIVVAARHSGGAPGIQTPPGAKASTAQGDGASLTLPAGWRQLPVESSGELLVVGTGAGPAVGCVPNIAPAPGGAVYIVIAEDVFVPLPGQSPLVLPPRPGQFTLTNGSELNCGDPPAATSPSSSPPTTSPPAAATPSTTTSTTGSAPTTSTTTPTGATHVLSYQFSASGHNVQGAVIAVDDPSGQLLNQGLAVLNSLQFSFTGPSLLPTTTLPHATGPGPNDPQAARQAIHDALISAFDDTGPVPQADSVQGGFPLSVTQQQAGRAANPGDVGQIVIRINWLRFIDATHATLNFDLLVNGQAITATTTGNAVVENGRWRIARATYCAIILRGGTIQCPS